jgi:2-polyprenyl-3-methyl-5-hydroxy-6-metoxy-1,4-benzoquinol methylase
MKDVEMKRTGDTVDIPADYQYRALTEGNAVQRFWHHNKRLCIERFLPPRPTDTIIDLGCGSGVVSSFLAQSGADVLGIDGNEDAVSFARSTFQAANLRFCHGLIDEEFETEKPADKIYCLEVIEHVSGDQGRTMLELIHRNLAGDGSVFLTTPNYRSPWPMIERLMDAFSAAPRMAGRQHVEHYNRRKLRSRCKDAGFRVETLATTCFLAPWLAPLSWSLALKVNSLETNRSLVPGCILVCVLKKDGA